jgi:hypothetical protein
MAVTSALYIGFNTVNVVGTDILEALKTVFCEAGGITAVTKNQCLHKEITPLRNDHSLEKSATFDFTEYDTPFLSR